VRTKDSCWSVGTIYDPRELPGVSTAGPGIGRGVTRTSVKQILVSHSSFACDLFFTLSLGLVYISNANPACSCA
jgi:hypothetical protein